MRLLYPWIVLAGVEYRKAPAALCGVALVHARQIAGKNGGFVAAGAGPYFHNDLIGGHGWGFDFFSHYGIIISMAEQKLILIVDDEPAFREIFGAKFAADGFRIETAENGQIGIEKAKALKPDLILMDVNMPVMDGATAVLKFRDDPETKDLKVVFLTNLGDPQRRCKN